MHPRPQSAWLICTTRPWVQLRMELSKRAAEVSALEARVSLQSDYIQQLEACVGQVGPSRHAVALVN